MSLSRKAARVKIATAAKATTTIADLMIDARGKLEEAWSNGHGVLQNPTFLRSQIATVRRQMDEAVATLDAAQWPSDPDYDAAE